MLLSVLAFVWQLGISGTAVGSDFATITATAVDSSGNVYITGFFRETINFGGTSLTNPVHLQDDIFIAKYNSSGVNQWAKRIGGSVGDKGLGIGTDSSGNVYVTGYFNDTVDFDPGAGTSNLVSAGNSDIFVVKLDTSGALVWAKGLGGTGVDQGLAISVMSTGTFAITGNFGTFGTGIDFGGGTLNSAGQSDIFVATYDSSGAYIWAVRVGGTGVDVGQAIAINSSGEVVMAGTFKGTVVYGCTSISSNGGASFRDVVVTKFDSSGTLLWIKRAGGTSDDIPYGVAMNAGGEVAITGSFLGTINFGGADRVNIGTGQDVFIAKWDSSGAWEWDSAYGTVGQAQTGSNCIAMDGSGNIAIGGIINGPTDLGGGPLCSGSCSSTDAYVAKYNSSGTHLFSTGFQPIPDTGYAETTYAVAFDSSGNLFVAGIFLNQINLGGGNLTNGAGNTTSAGFLGKFSP